MIQRVEDFVAYFASIRRRTLNYINTVPPDQIDWSPKPDELTAGDIIRHLAAAEQMFVGAVVIGRWHYVGHERAAHPTLEAAIAHLEAVHTSAMASLRTLADTALEQPRSSLDGPPIKAWRLLMALVEHEIHHRSQLAMYLSLMGVTPPQIYGLGVEDVIARATG